MNRLNRIIAGFLAVFALAFQVRVAGSAAPTNFVEMTLVSQAAISGTIRDGLGAPVANAVVNFEPGNFPGEFFPAETNTDANGHYVLNLRMNAETLNWDGPVEEYNVIIARDLKRNLAAFQDFMGSPSNL